MLKCTCEYICLDVWCPDVFAWLSLTHRSWGWKFTTISLVCGLVRSSTHLCYISQQPYHLRLSLALSWPPSLFFPTTPLSQHCCVSFTTLCVFFHYFASNFIYPPTSQSLSFLPTSPFPVSSSPCWGTGGQRDRLIALLVRAWRCLPSRARLKFTDRERFLLRPGVDS